MKRILTYSLIGAFVLLNIADTITTLISYYIRPNFNETNIAYLLIGNIWVALFIIKGLLVLALFVVFRVLKSKSEFGVYSVVLALILGCLMLFVAVHNNIKVIQNPQISVETSKYITAEAIKMNTSEKEVKAEIYKDEFINPYFRSLGLILVIFLVYLRIMRENL